MNLIFYYEYSIFDDSLNHEAVRIEGRMQKMEQDPGYYSWNYDLYGYSEHGIYVDKIKHWMEVFPKEQFLIIQSEEFLEHKSKTFEQVLKFLGLPVWEPDEYVLYKKRDYKESMDPELRKKLTDNFKPHNQRLYEFLGRKFDWE